MAGRVTTTWEINVGATYELLNGILYTTSPAGLQEFLAATVFPYIKQRAASRFRGDGDDASGQWAPLAESTRRIRESGIASGEYVGITRSRPINRRTGELEAYITNGHGTFTSTSSGSTLAYPQATTPNNMVKKVRRAQQGDARTPARPVLAVGHTDLTFVTNALYRFIVTGGK